MSKPFKVILFDDHILDGNGNHIMPVWWKNFSSENLCYSIEDVNKVSSQWNFIFYTEFPNFHYGKRWAVFSSKEDFTAFVLRWS